MIWKGNPATFLKAKQHPAFEQFRGDKLESNARFDQGKIILPADLVHHRRGGKRFNNTSPALSICDEMLKQKANQLMRAEWIAAAIHTPDSIGVAVRHKANVMRMLREERGSSNVILSNRLGIDASEIWIVRGI